MSYQVAFVHSTPALRAHAPVPLHAKIATPSIHDAAEPHAQAYGLGSCAALAVVAAAGARRVRRSKVQQRRPRLALLAAAGTPDVPLTGSTLNASLKMHCDASGADYAMYWANENGMMVVVGEYVPDARKAELKGKGFEKTFAEESEPICFDVSGVGPVAHVWKTQKPVFVKDVSSSDLMRKEMAAKYGVNQICMLPFEAGVLECGSASDTWGDLPKSPVMPKEAMRRAYEDLGACYSMFWAKDGDNFKVVADYVTDAHKQSLKASRGDDETFCSKSREFTIDPSSEGPIAKAYEIGREVTVWDVAVAPMKRAALAAEFGINRIHFVPILAGVLECGIPGDAMLTGPTLAAALKMRCDTSGAGYALYWTEQDGKAAVAGDYVAPTAMAETTTMVYAKESKGLKLDIDDGPVAMVLKTRAPFYIQDAAQNGIKSICLVPVPGGVLEIGTSDDPCSGAWTCMEDANQASMPKGEMKKAFDSGATHTLFWWKKGEEYVVGGSYVIPECVAALKAARGDDKTYASESESVKVPANSLGPVATAARSGGEITLEDPSTDPTFKRAGLAKLFGVTSTHFVPCRDGVLEYGTSSIQ